MPSFHVRKLWCVPSSQTTPKNVLAFVPSCCSVKKKNRPLFSGPTPNYNLIISGHSMLNHGRDRPRLCAALASSARRTPRNAHMQGVRVSSFLSPPMDPPPLLASGHRGVMVCVCYRWQSAAAFGFYVCVFDSTLHIPECFVIQKEQKIACRDVERRWKTTHTPA